MSMFRPSGGFATLHFCRPCRPSSCDLTPGRLDKFRFTLGDWVPCIKNGVPYTNKATKTKIHSDWQLLSSSSQMYQDWSSDMDFGRWINPYRIQHETGHAAMRNHKSMWHAGLIQPQHRCSGLSSILAIWCMCARTFRWSTDSQK